MILIIQGFFFTYTRYFIFQIRAPGGHDTTFIISTYTINKVKYNNYCITINHVCHRLKQREVIQARLSQNFIQLEYSIYSYIYIHIYIIIINNKCKQVFYV